MFTIRNTNEYWLNKYQSHPIFVFVYITDVMYCFYEGEICTTLNLTFNLILIQTVLMNVLRYIEEYNINNDILTLLIER